VDIVKEAIKQNVENFLESSFHVTKNIEIMKTNINNLSCNFCFINSSPSDQDIDFIKNKLNINAIILSKEYFNLDIDGVSYISEIPLMKREEVPDFYKAPHYDNLEILNVKDYPGAIKDYVEIFAKVRGMEKDDIDKIFNYEGLKDNNHFFVAYLSENPAGFFHAINYGDSAFIMGTGVKNQYRNSGLLTAMAKSAKEYALNIGIYNFYALPTSEFSIRVMNDQGYKNIDSYHVWQNVK
jgi:N-acetylglutamate synthase-like GNAT family acetyltransferase